jgi:hypothetical protein
VHFCLLRFILMNSFRPIVDVKPLLQVAGVIVAEVVPIVLHAVRIDLPNLILPDLGSKHL